MNRDLDLLTYPYYQDVKDMVPANFEIIGIDSGKSKSNNLKYTKNIANHLRIDLENSDENPRPWLWSYK